MEVTLLQIHIRSLSEKKELKKYGLLHYFIKDLLMTDCYQYSIESCTKYSDFGGLVINWLSYMQSSSEPFD